MRELDHVRRPGYLAALKEISRRAQAEDRAAWAEKVKQAKVVAANFTQARMWVLRKTGTR